MEIRKVEPVLKTTLDLKKEREKQNEEKRRALLEKKRLLEEMKKMEGKGCSSVHKQQNRPIGQ